MVRRGCPGGVSGVAGDVVVVVAAAADRRFRVAVRFEIGVGGGD